MFIAILDDDPILLEHLAFTLECHLDTSNSPMGSIVSCKTFVSGEALRNALRHQTFDLLVLDWNVPDLSGMDLLKWLRTYQEHYVPVIILSSRESERDVAAALKNGADDYIIKPFRPMEVCARIHRLVHPRTEPRLKGEIFGSWTLDARSRKAKKAATSQHPGVEIILTDGEFRLISVLFRHMGHIVARTHLLESAGFNGEELTSRTLDSHIYRLRNHLFKAEYDLRLHTVYGKGYRLEDLSTELVAVAS